MATKETNRERQENEFEVIQVFINFLQIFRLEFFFI